MKLEDVEGIGEGFAAKLRAAGVATTDALLNTGCNPKGRKELAEKTGIREGLLLEWCNHVDLFRIKGIGSEYADLLEEAGVDTVPELARRSPANLYQKLVEINQSKKLTRRPPTEAQVEAWINEAKSLPRIMTY